MSLNYNPSNQLHLNVTLSGVAVSLVAQTVKNLPAK